MSACLRALSALALFASLGALSIGCQQRKESVPVQAAALTPVPMNVPAPTPAPILKENALDTSTGTTLSSKTILPPPEQHKSYPKVNTPADERLPSWVPQSGRLTVVSSHDLAKNLGMPQPPANASPAAPPQNNLGALPPPASNPNEGGFVVRPATPARASFTPRHGRHPKKR